MNAPSFTRGVTTFAAAFAAALVAAAPTARAQQCADGLVPTEEGYCCWPGQRWNTSLRACDGPPSCPAGMTARGLECVAAPSTPSSQGDTPTSAGPPAAASTETPAAAPEAPPIVPDPSAAASAASWPTTDGAVPSGRRFELRRGPTFGLLWAGVGIFLGGYVLGAATAAILPDAFPPTTRTFGLDMTNEEVSYSPMLFIPLLHAAGVADSSVVRTFSDDRSSVDSSRTCGVTECTAAYTLAAVATAVEIVGLITILVGALPRDHVETRRVNDGLPDVSLLPGAPGADAGLSLRGTW